MKHEEIWLFFLEIWTPEILEEGIKQKKTWTVWWIVEISQEKTEEWKEDIYRQENSLHICSEILSMNYLGKCNS